MYQTYCRQDTITLCKILSSCWNLETDNSFLYLLSFPSLIESQSKVKQHKGFFVRNTYPNTLCKGMLEQLITLWGQLVVDSKCSQFEPGGHSSLKRLIHFLINVECNYKHIFVILPLKRKLNQSHSCLETVKYEIVCAIIRVSFQKLDVNTYEISYAL